MIQWFCRKAGQFGNWYGWKKYQFRHWMFKWVQDDGGDIGLMVAGMVCLIKYKEHTIVYFRWNRKDWKTFVRAGKWQGHETPDNPSSREVVLTNG